MWTAMIEDRPVGAADVLDPLAKAGANLEFAFARRAPEQPGKGLLFVVPVKGAKGLRAAQDAGLAKAEGIHTVRVEGVDKPGTTAAIARALAGRGDQFPGALGDRRRPDVRRFSCARLGRGRGERGRRAEKTVASERHRVRSGGKAAFAGEAMRDPH